MIHVLAFYHLHQLAKQNIKNSHRKLGKASVLVKPVICKNTAAYITRTDIVVRKKTSLKTKKKVFPRFATHN